jgi:hypothetical protein
MGFNIFAMPASSILLLFSVALGVSNALPWAGPQPTNAYEPDAWSPVPTGAPADPARLFKRTSVDVNVCGWIGGNWHLLLLARVGHLVSMIRCMDMWVVVLHLGLVRLVSTQVVWMASLQEIRAS